MVGSHGSLTKAGKVKGQTPKVESRKIAHPIPRIRYRRAYIKQIIKGKKAGQP